MKDKITKEKLEKYKNLTANALKIAEKSVITNREKEAREIIEMVKNYLLDSGYFEKNKDFVNAFAALNYAHGWLDSGARLGIFDSKDDNLFTIK
ncbi:MAG TPA: DUF357 domain-containing protein [Candidatus Pacearchaeota archaeon]|nr:DUF357 domain-containing protein [Candidatus Pacearchaeota archaeon]